MDRIGPFDFIRLSRPPQRAQPRWERAARAGVAGVALWDTAERGEPFVAESLALTVNFAAGRALFVNYLTLVPLGGVPVIYGTLEPQQLYKVLQVELVQMKAIPRGHIANELTNYQCLVTARWELLPLNPFVQGP